MLMSSGYSTRLSLRSRSTLSLRNVWEGNSKIWLTGMAAANALGRELPMFVIGKLAKPLCSSGVQNIPCRNSWMDSVLF